MSYREIEVPIDEDDKDTDTIISKTFTKTKSGYPRWSATVRKCWFENKKDEVLCYISYKYDEDSWWESNYVSIPLDLLPLILEVFSTPLKKEA